MKLPLLTCLALTLASTSVMPASAQEEHHHGMPEHLGTAHFATSCSPAVQPAFDRALALLHSFAYDAADMGFADVAARDPNCAIAHWGRAMTHYHQLWDVPAGAGLAAGIAEIDTAAGLSTAATSTAAMSTAAMSTAGPQERALIGALKTYYDDAGTMTPAARALRYSDAMAAAATAYSGDDEIAIFYALSLIATAPPGDKSHQRQKHAADILEPIWQRQPDHPGVPHYLIHAYDSAELAPRGLPAARAYAKIAPSAPHALHMPSHIFTRLGLWDDSIVSNIAARQAALSQHDVGEALHAMDYLTYAYLQKSQVADAAKVVADMKAMTGLNGSGFKIGYAGNAMPVRLAIETRDWTTAAQLTALPDSAPQVAALVWWARAVGKSRAASALPADADIAQLLACHAAVVAANDSYWAAQTDALLKSAQAWQAMARGDTATALVTLTAAADEEDALEKLPLTPGPIVPAREQLGELFLRLNRPQDAQKAFDAALVLAPGRRGAMGGRAEAAARLRRG